MILIGCVIWPGTLLIKDIMRTADAQACVERGADGIVVSNHGGRNMDSAPSKLDVLPSVVKAVGPHTQMIVDLGVRCGSDIIKCLALGTHFVLTGRATLYGVAAGGQSGAQKALGFLEDELRRTIAYIGARSLADIDEKCLWHRP